MPTGVVFPLMSIPENIKILPPWNIVSAGDSEKLRRELQQELPPGHELTGLLAIAVARRFDQDDVLFEISNCETPLAQVHLTFRKEKDLKWPLTKFFRNWEQWVTESMLPANQQIDAQS